MRSSTRKSWTVFSIAGNRLKLPPKPTMFQGSTSAPHSMPRWSRSSISGRLLGDGVELVGVDRLMAGGEQAIDLAQHAGRGDAHAVGLGERGFGVAHAGVELREVHMLHLDRAAAGQLVVQMLPGTAERLPGALRFGAQAVAVRAGRVGQQLLRRTGRGRRRCAAAGSRA